jgi:GWxTD domain-containing protein
MRYITGLVVWLMAIAVPQAWAQPRPQMQPREGPRFVHFEAVNLPSADSATSRIDVFYRIDKQFFIPVRNEDPSFPWEFMRRGEILVELIDTNETSAAREIKRSEIGSNNPDTEMDTKEWHQGFATFAVPPGKYRIVFEIDDLESDRRFFDRNATVLARRFPADSFSVSDPVMILGTGEVENRQTVQLQNFGGDILYGLPASLLFPVELPGVSASVQTSFTISEMPLADEPGPPVVRDSMATPVTLRGVWPTAEEDSSGLFYSLSPSDDPQRGVVLLTFPATQLPLRRFKLTATLSVGQSKRETTKFFRIVWPDMPISLRDVDYAIDALRYIVSEQKLDSLNSGSFEARRDNLEQFWRQRDPDPKTAYNEVMAQYYRRVDYAAKAYGTLREPDGSKTDRGKVYILHGPPSKTQRSLDPDRGFREVWTYDTLGKEFVFADRSKSGNYTLISSRSL